jgi:hypothetical protein
VSAIVFALLALFSLNLSGYIEGRIKATGLERDPLARIVSLGLYAIGAAAIYVLAR